jgi:hypothetical protein
VQVAEAASDTQQTEPEPQPAGGGSTKKDKERQRKERQRQRKIEEASEALDGAMARMAETRGSVEAVEEAMQAAAKFDGRSEPLEALVAEAKGMLEQARAAEAGRARVAAEAAAAAAAVKAAAEAAAAAERLQAEEEVAALTVRLQQAQARLGVPLAAPAPQAEEELCVMCLDARKDHIILPCGHQCVCKGCAEQLTRTKTPTCPLDHAGVHLSRGWNCRACVNNAEISWEVTCTRTTSEVSRSVRSSLARPKGAPSRGWDRGARTPPAASGACGATHRLVTAASDVYMLNEIQHTTKSPSRVRKRAQPSAPSKYRTAVGEVPYFLLAPHVYTTSCCVRTGLYRTGGACTARRQREARRVQHGQLVLVAALSGPCKRVRPLLRRSLPHSGKHQG